MAFLIALFLLNAGYGFERPFERLGDFPFVSESLGGSSEQRSGPAANRFAGSWLGDLPVPVPWNYLIGIDVQKRDFESYFNSYLCGE